MLAFAGLAAVYLIGLFFGSPLLPSAGSAISAVAVWSRPDGADVAVVLAVVVSGPGGTVPTDWPLVAVLQLAGAAAVTVGCLRTHRPSPR
jgi:hypothetical protein